MLYKRSTRHREFLVRMTAWTNRGLVPSEGLIFTDLEQYPDIVRLHIQDQSSMDFICQIVALHQRIPWEKHGFQISWLDANLLVTFLTKPAVDALVTTKDVKYALGQIDEQSKTRADRAYRRRSFK
jgi:hypothetical protein